MMCLYTYTTEEAVFLIGWSALLFIVGYLSRKYHNLKANYNIMKEKYVDTKNMYDLSAERCVEIEKKLDFYKNNERAFKVEKVISQPLELQCRIQFDTNYPEDEKQKFIYQRLCDELQRAFEENPDICLIQTEDSLFDMRQNVRVRVRFLPYIHGTEY